MMTGNTKNTLNNKLNEEIMRITSKLKQLLDKIEQLRGIYYCMGAYGIARELVRVEPEQLTNLTADELTYFSSVKKAAAKFIYEPLY